MFFSSSRQLRKTEIIMDFRKRSTDPAPLSINGECVDRVHSFKFLGLHITDNLSWTVNTAAVAKKAQQRLHFLRVLRRNNLEKKLLVMFHRATVESILTYCITVWYSGCTAADRRALQRAVNTAQKITGCSLPSLDTIASSRYLSRATDIITDCFTCCPPVGATGHTEQGPIDSGTVFFPRAICALNQTRRT